MTEKVDGERLDDDEKDLDRLLSVDKKYRVVVGRSTLDLYEPSTGKRVVQMLRFREKPVISASGRRSR